MKKPLLLALFVLLFCSAPAAPEAYYFSHLKVESGLTQNTVMAILQDRKGFMWFGTKDGLNRYDGYKFKSFRHIPGDTASLGNNFVRTLYEHTDGNLWVGTDNGLFIYDRRMETFSRFARATSRGESINNEIMGIVTDSRGIMWIGVYREGLFRYDPASGSLSLVCHRAGSADGFSSNDIWSICIDSDNRVWIGTAGGGLNMYDEASGQVQVFNVPDKRKRNDIMFVIEDSNTSLLLGSNDNGVYHFDKVSGRMEPFINNPEGSMYVHQITKVDNNTLWLGTESGLYLWDRVTGALKNIRLNLSNKYSLSSNAIYAIYRDRDNGIWAGTYFGGVNYLPQGHDFFHRYYPTNEPNSLSGNIVRELCEDAKGNIWIGTEDSGLNYFNPSTGEFRHLDPSNSNLSYVNVHGLMLDGDNLWVGYFFHGLDIMNLRTGRVRNYKNDGTARSISDNNVFSLLKDSRGTYWVGTICGLNTFDLSSGTFTLIPEVGPRAFVYDIMEDRRGNIWIATFYTGIFVYTPSTGQWKQYLHCDQDVASLGYDRAMSLTEDSRGNIWVATEGGGLSVYNPVTETFRTYTVADGLPNNVVHKILEDRSGKLWISTNNGLARFDPETQAFTTYTYARGLLGNQFNYKSGLKASDGKLYFGSIQGFIHFDARKMMLNTTAPPVVITRFDLFNEEQHPAVDGSPLKSSIGYGEDIVLRHKQSTFSFEFAALSYNASEMNQYAYRLKGLEQNWTYLKANQRVNYANIPFGHYVFEVRGANSDGIWNNEGASVRIRILPPFWASTLGVIIEVVLGCALISTLVLLYRRRLMLRHRTVVERMRADEDMSIQKAKMQFFANITHEIRTPLSLIKAPFEQIAKPGAPAAEIAENLEIMGSNINRLMNLTNELLDMSKVENLGFTLHLRVADVGQIVRTAMHNFKLDFHDRRLYVSVALPEEGIITSVDPEILQKIFTNLVSNAAKFAAGRIQVQLQDNMPEQGWFRFTILNDGEVILPANRENVFTAFFRENADAGVIAGTGLGLSLVRQLTELHGGRVYIDPTVRDMNSFVVEIPKSDEAQPDDPAQENAAEDEIPDSDSKRRIIIAEDDAGMRQFLRKSLSKFYHVTVCQNGEEVLAALAKRPADLILSDVTMPVMDGITLCQKLKTMFDYSHIPVILLTARTDPGTKIEGIDSGADAFIEKPFSMDFLQTRIENLLLRLDRLKEAFRSNPDTQAGSIASNKTDEIFLRQINDIIVEHIMEENFSVDQMAEILNVSRSNLYRKIKGVSQMAPNEFIRLCRLRRAADLLREGNYRINEICYLVGFNSPSYFAKCFQRQFGVSPKDFAK